MADLTGVKVGDALLVRHWLSSPTSPPRALTVSKLTPKFAVTYSEERFRLSDGRGFGYPAHKYIAERAAR